MSKYARSKSKTAEFKANNHQSIFEIRKNKSMQNLRTYILFAIQSEEHTSRVRSSSATAAARGINSSAAAAATGQVTGAMYYIHHIIHAGARMVTLCVIIIWRDSVIQKRYIVFFVRPGLCTQQDSYRTHDTKTKHETQAEIGRNIRNS